jgi:hypothetical protein
MIRNAAPILIFWAVVFLGAVAVGVWIDQQIAAMVPIGGGA